ncbi:MAG: zinc ribbon-containing protein [Gammaproteobacteria bacterium]|nr:zinc ribbon-containing protein [Gammaproteobacteria bacterium]
MSDSKQEKLIQAYNTMLGRVKEALKDTEAKALPTIKQAMDKAAETASELGELSREEAEKIGDYLRRDLHEGAEFLTESGRQLKDWLAFDLEYAEVKLAEMFVSVADKTRIELEKLAQRARQVGEWHTGEITGIGILRCQACDELLHFEKTGHVPPCPKCKGTVFNKHFGGDEEQD